MPDRDSRDSRLKNKVQRQIKRHGILHEFSFLTEQEFIRLLPNTTPELLSSTQQHGQGVRLGLP